MSLSPRRIGLWLPAAAVGFALAGSGFAFGHWLTGGSASARIDLSGPWSRELAEQRADLERTRAQLRENTHALSRRLAQLQARLTRLDAAGARMTEIADLDSGEFDFDKPPPVGGPESEAGGDAPSLDQIASSLDGLERQLDNRERQMSVLEDLLLAGRLQKEVKPSGWPIGNGWISSTFGMRTDPFTGLRAFHAGVDFAGRDGAQVLAVASGIVTEAGEDGGYGDLVEINHGNGYATRYGHNKKILVKVGERVHKGQRIAIIGSTGRSTGPHVHFEVLLNGHTVNPQQYIRAAR